MSELFLIIGRRSAVGDLMEETMGGRCTRDELVAALRGVVAAPTSGLSLDNDEGGPFRGVELEEFRFKDDGDPNVIVRPGSHRIRRRKKYDA